MPAPLSYSRFDQICDDSDDEAEVSKPNAASSQRKLQLLAQHDAMFLLVGWLGKAKPKLSPVETTRLVRFVATTDKVANDDREQRLDAIVKFMRDEGCDNKLDRTALIALCSFANDRVSEAGDASERIAASRVLLLAMGALNTLDACSAEGGAAALVAKLESDPALATRFDDYEYAKAAIRGAPEATPAEAPRVEELTGGEGGSDDDAEMTPEQEAALMRQAMANAKRKGEEAARRAVASKAGRPAWIGIARSVSWHLGLVGVAYLCRLAYEHFTKAEAIIDAGEL